MATPVGSGVNRHTGRPVSGWEHTLLCLEEIFCTPYGSRVMRRWLGSIVPHMLGENLVPETILRFRTGIMAALEQEPRFHLQFAVVVSTADELRQGKLKLELHGQYRPRAHLGDFTVEGPRRVMLIGANDDTPIVLEAAA